jgi:hypothetical protein
MISEVNGLNFNGSHQFVWLGTLFLDNFCHDNKKVHHSQILGLCNLRNTWKKDGDGKVPSVHYRGDLGSRGVDCFNHSCRSAWQSAACRRDVINISWKV